MGHLLTGVMIFLLMLTAITIDDGGGLMRGSTLISASSSSSRRVRPVRKFLLRMRRSSSLSSSAIPMIDLGAVIHLVDNKFIVYSTKLGSPAVVSDLRAGDEIFMIGGQPLNNGMSIDEVTRKLNGPKGTTVAVRVGRLNGGIQDITVKREEYSLPDFSTSYVDTIGVITVNTFGSQLSSNIRAACEEMAKRSLLGVVVDVRPSPQGTIPRIGTLLSCFLPKGTKYARTYPHVESNIGEIFYSTREEPVFNPAPKIVVLMRHPAGAAAGVTALALQSFAQAQLFIQPTRGLILPYADLDEFSMNTRSLVLHLSVDNKDVKSFTSKSLDLIPVQEAVGVDKPLERAISFLKGF